MLFTRCPECETTFRVTDETLQKAHGQVRCGRCAGVFNGYAELRDFSAEPLQRSAPASDGAPQATSAAPTTEIETTPATPAAQVTQQPLAAAPTAAPITAIPAALVPTDPVAASLGVRSLADVVTQVEQAAAAAPEPHEEPSTAMPAAAPDEPISPREVDAVLAAPSVVSAPSELWPPFGARPEPSTRRRRWNAAALIALLALGAQTVHHYRAEVAANPTFGPMLQQTYAWLGAEVHPRWDVQQYRIVDWIATAEPNARGLGSLKITAHIENQGPLRQPYPAVRLRLKDRWEEAVASRLFSPVEYLPSATPLDRLMSPGETARAEIEIVDPGPDADGFELDVCIDVEASALSCGTDEVFRHAAG
jgi:predicted Zn finger-like uncharacterized protein